MIEINLLPGSVRRVKRRALPKLGGGAVPKLPAFDRGMAIVVAAWLAVLGGIGYLHASTARQLDHLRADQEAAARDSARYAMLRAQGDSLAAQEALVAQRMQLIQEIDASRYVTAHLLDEVSRALPPYIWVTNMTEVAVNEGYPRVRLEGRAGNYYALGKYIEDLEDSPFLRGVRLLSSARSLLNERVVLSFYLEFDYHEPAPDAIQTVPLFASLQEN